MRTFSGVGPVSRTFGFERGLPIERYYIEKFLEGNKQFITGNVLEIADSRYSKKFGVNITQYNSLSIQPGSGVTIVANLTDKHTLPENRMDCFICTQTLNMIYDFKSAIEGGYHLLKPGGVMLATVAGLCQISRYDMDNWGDYWRFTDLSIKRSFGEVFGEKNIEVKVYGNSLAACYFIRGMASNELEKEELDYVDADYQILISVFAKKANE